MKVILRHPKQSDIATQHTRRMVLCVYAMLFIWFHIYLSNCKLKRTGLIIEGKQLGRNNFFVYNYFDQLAPTTHEYTTRQIKGERATYALLRTGVI